jgi:hypothetical protein
MAERPKAYTSLAEKELNKAEEQFKAYDENVQSLTMDRMNQAPKADQEPIHKIAQADISQSKDIYLKPSRSIPSAEKFNESYRKEYEFQKEYVFFIAEHREIIGEDIQLWIKLFPGMNAEEWKVPVGKPIWAPRYVAERIKGCSYHRLVMHDRVTQDMGSMGQFYGQLAVDTQVQRLDALPATKQKSLFMGAVGF